MAADAARRCGVRAEVFAALRGDGRRSRAEPLLAIVFLAGHRRQCSRRHAFSRRPRRLRARRRLTLAVVALHRGRACTGSSATSCSGSSRTRRARAAGSTCRSGAHGRSSRSRSCRSRCRCSCGPCGSRSTVATRSHRRLGHRARRPPLRGGRGRGARAVGVRWSSASRVPRLVDRSRARCRAPALALLALAS